MELFELNEQTNKMIRQFVDKLGLNGNAYSSQIYSTMMFTYTPEVSLGNFYTPESIDLKNKLDSMNISQKQKEYILSSGLIEISGRFSNVPLDTNLSNQTNPELQNLLITCIHEKFHANRMILTQVPKNDKDIDPIFYDNDRFVINTSETKESYVDPGQEVFLGSVDDSKDAVKYYQNLSDNEKDNLYFSSDKYDTKMLTQTMVDEILIELMSIITYELATNKYVNIMSIIKDINKKYDDDNIHAMTNIILRHNDLDLFKWMIDPLTYQNGDIHYDFFSHYITDKDIGDLKTIELGQTPFDSETFNARLDIEAEKQKRKDLMVVQNDELIVPESITEIYENEFEERTDFEKVVLPKDISAIGKGAFNNCYKLTEISFPNNLLEIDENAFVGCSRLVNINLPESLTSIGRNAFYNCSSLKSVVFPNSLSTISNNLLNGCINLKKVILPSNLLEIDDAAFSGCYNLESIKLPNSLVELGIAAFHNCTDLKEIILPTNLPIIHECVFEGCSSLQKVVLSEETKIIEQSAFLNCYNLKEINLPNSIEEIHSNAFSGCNEIEEINLPNSIRLIEEDVFSANTLVTYKNLKFKNNQLLTSDDNIDKMIYNALETYIHKGSGVQLSELVLKDIKTINKDNFELFKNIDKRLFNSIVAQNGDAFFKQESLIVDNIYANLKYLEKQNLIDSEVLKSIYLGFDFDFSSESKQAFEQKLRDKISNLDLELLSTLFIESNDINKLELRDRLTFVSTMKYLDKNSGYMDIQQAITMLKRNTFSNLISTDNELYNRKGYSKISNRLVTNDKVLVKGKPSSEYFGGIKYHLTKEIAAINQELIGFFDKHFYDENLNTTSFLNSLNTINSWDNFDNPKDRATILKNEIIGRIIYGLVRINAEKTPEYQAYLSTVNSLGDSGVDIGKKVRALQDYKAFVTDKDRFKISYTLDKSDEQKFWDYISKSDFNDMAKNKFNIFDTDEFYIERMIADNPYTFDMLRGSNQIYSSYYINAFKNNYLFKGDELKSINQSSIVHSSIDTIAWAIINDIGISKIPEENEKEYLNNVNALINSYFAKEIKDDKDLFAIFRSVDAYLRKNSEYDYQEIKDPETRKLSKEIFDFNNSKYNNNDRLCYCLYNLNRLAHSISEINNCIIKIEYSKYKTDISTENEKIESGLSGYNNLQKYGIPVATINSGIVNSAALEPIVNTQIFVNKITAIEKELNDKVATNKDFDKIKDTLILLINSDCMHNNLLNLEDTDIKSATSNRDLLTIINNVKSTNRTIIDSNLEKIRTNVAAHIQSNFTKVEDINTATDDDLKMIATYIYDIKRLDDKTKEKVKMDAEEQRLFFRTKSLVAIEYLNTLNNYMKEKALSIDPTNQGNKSFFKENGYLIEFQADSNGTNEILVCYNPKFHEPFSVHMKDMTMIKKGMFNSMIKNTLSHTKVDSGLTESKITECKKNQILPAIGPGFVEIRNQSFENQKNIKTAIKVINFLNYDTIIIKDEIDNFLNSSPTLEELDDFIKSIDAKIPITNADTVYFESQVISVKEIYESIIEYSKLINARNALISSCSKSIIDEELATDSMKEETDNPSISKK